MGYKIDYKNGVSHVQNTPVPNCIAGRKAFILLLLLIIGSVMLFSLRTNGFDWYQLLPGDANITKAALSELVDDLSEGVQFKDAITAFCTEIIDGAQLE